MARIDEFFTEMLKLEQQLGKMIYDYVKSDNPVFRVIVYSQTGSLYYYHCPDNFDQLFKVRARNRLIFEEKASLASVMHPPKGGVYSNPDGWVSMLEQMYEPTQLSITAKGFAELFLYRSIQHQISTDVTLYDANPLAFGSQTTTSDFFTKAIILEIK